MKYIIKIGNLYVCYLGVENYNFEIQINFTHDIEQSKEFNENEINIVKDIINYLMCDCTIIAVKESELN